MTTNIIYTISKIFHSTLSDNSDLIDPICNLIAEILNVTTVIRANFKVRTNSMSSGSLV